AWPPPPPLARPGRSLRSSGCSAARCASPAAIPLRRRARRERSDRRASPTRALPGEALARRARVRAGLVALAPPVEEFEEARQQPRGAALVRVHVRFALEREPRRTDDGLLGAGLGAPARARARA